MKKRFAYVGMFALVMALASCGGNKDTTKTIRLQLTSSVPAESLTQSANQLKPLLEKEMPGYRFVISAGTSFAADAQGLVAGTIDASFMTASTFAQSEISSQGQGKIDMILRATRSGFKVINDFADEKGSHSSDAARKLQAKAMNGEINDPATDKPYVYKADSAGIASYYYAECITTKANADKWKQESGKSEISLADLAGKKVGMMGTSSPAGYSYPLFAFHNETNGGTWTNGMTPVTDEASCDASKGQFVKVQQSGYGAAFTALTNGQIDALWGYMDIRNSAYAGGQGFDAKWKNNDEVFTSTYTIALTQGILNDGVAVRSGLDADTKTKLATAFKNIVKDGANADGTRTKGSGSDVIFGLYSHTGYVDAKNADYDDELAFQKWAVANL